jgi:hypothetical protein
MSERLAAVRAGNSARDPQSVGAFGAIFVLAIVALRALFGKFVASQEARIRDLQFCEQINASLLTILGFVRQIQQQGRSRSNMERRDRERAAGKP